jgi:hypothetical protein
MTKNSSAFRALTAAAAIAALGVVVTAGDAQARRGSGPDNYVEWNFKTPSPVHGYSGWAGAGSRQFCDYRRIPDRKCTYTADGQSKCKVVGWTLQQYCY